LRILQSRLLLFMKNVSEGDSFVNNLLKRIGNRADRGLGRISRSRTPLGRHGGAAASGWAARFLAALIHIGTDALVCPSGAKPHKRQLKQTASEFARHAGLKRPRMASGSVVCWFRRRICEGQRPAPGTEINQWGGSGLRGILPSRMAIW
jgi:hypothetical protein